MGLPATWFAVLQSSKPDTECWRRSKSSSTWTKNQTNQTTELTFHKASSTKKKKFNLSHCQSQNRLTVCRLTLVLASGTKICVVSTTTLPVTGKPECKHVYATTFCLTRANKSWIFLSPAREIFLELIFGALCCITVHSIKHIRIKLSSKTTSPTSPKNPQEILHLKPHPY